MYLTQGLHRSVQREPDAIAVVDGQRQLTFAQLESRVARLAGMFTSYGLDRGDRVGILATNCLGMSNTPSPVPGRRWSRPR